MAGALEAGVSRVQAVEIDPAIVDLGRARHPGRPYGSPQVSLAVDDARAFFRKDTGPYDLVWLGLLDSHTTPVGVLERPSRPLRLHARELRGHEAAAGSVGRRRAPVRPPSALDRRPPGRALPRHLRDGAAGLRRPVVHGLPGLWRHDVRRRIAVHDGGAATAGRRRSEVWPAGCCPAEAFTFKTELTTDDWPYLYLARRAVPRFYLLVGGAGLFLAWILRKRLFTAQEPLHLPMLLLGAGFMLLEVTAVSRAALLYGTTWKVNAYVVGAMLSMVLLANLVAARLRPLRHGLAFRRPRARHPCHRPRAHGLAGRPAAGPAHRRRRRLPRPARLLLGTGVRAGGRRNRSGARPWAAT